MEKTGKEFLVTKIEKCNKSIGDENFRINLATFTGGTYAIIAVTSVTGILPLSAPITIVEILGASTMMLLAGISIGRKVGLKEKVKELEKELYHLEMKEQEEKGKSR